ncbi:MAG: RNA 2',3'-cyclic phosphodiesterase [Candidatus Micrarchaeota archaeon]
MRFFVSVGVPVWIKRAIYSVQCELLGKPLGDKTINGVAKATSGGAKVTVVNNENIHITIKFLGEVDSKKIQKIEQQLRTVEYPAFNVAIEGIGAFPNKQHARVIWARCKTQELVEFANEINKALPEFPSEQFVGHITLARIKKMDMKQFFEKYQKWKFGDFKVENFYLMASELSPSGAKHHVIAEYKCQPKDYCHGSDLNLHKPKGELIMY